MERLIILRHGKAERSAESGEDFDRALTERGREDAAAVGRWLAVTGSVPDLALVSSAVRTVQTFEAVRAAFPRAALKTSQALYLASADLVYRAAQNEAATARNLLVVGHNPGLHELALRLALAGGGAPADLQQLRLGFPTATVAVFRFEDGTPSLQGVHIARPRP